MKKKRDPRIERIRTQERAKERATRAGLDVPEKPEDELPALDAEFEDLAEWNDRDLMAEFVMFTRWADYLNVQVILAEITEETAGRIHRRLKDIAMLSIDAPKGEVLRAKAEAGLSDDVLEAEEEEASSKAYRKLVTGIYENVVRDASALSREISRRSDREPLDRRDRRWGGG